MSQFFLDTSGGGGGGGDLPASVNTYYVDKAGSDSNSGLSIDKPFLNMQTAIDAANAQSPKWGVVAMDNGSYGSISIPGGVNVYAPSATISSVVFSGSGSSELQVANITGATTAVSITSNMTAYVRAYQVFGSTTGLSQATGTSDIIANNFGGGTNSLAITTGVCSITANVLVGDISNTSGTASVNINTFFGATPSSVNAFTNFISSDALYNQSVIRPQAGGKIQSAQVAGGDFTLQAYDVDNNTYRDFIGLTSDNAPTCFIQAPSGSGSCTMDGFVVGSFTPAAGTFTTGRANVFGSNLTTTATAAGTTTLTASSNQNQVFTGSTTQTVVLPVVTTLFNGFPFTIVNNSSGVVTVQTSGGNTIQAMDANTTLMLICINTAGGTGTASWSWRYGQANSGIVPVSGGGTGRSSDTAYALIAGGTTTTGPQQSLGTGTSGQILTSAGSSALPSFLSTMDGITVGATTRANAQFYTPVNAQTGTTYTLVSNDCGKLITANNSSAQTYTLPQQSTLTTVTGYWAWIRNIGTATVTLVKEGSETLTGNTTLAPGAQAYIYRNTTTNWAVFGGTTIVNMPGYNTLIQTVSNVTYTLVGYAGNSGTLLGVYQKARSVGTAGTFNIQINGVNVTSLTSLVPSTGGSYTTATAANTFARGDQITIVFSGSASVLDMNVCLDITQQF